MERGLVQSVYAKRFFRSPNSLCIGFTFPMDANTSKYVYNYFMEIKQTLIRHWENPKGDQVVRTAF